MQRGSQIIEARRRQDEKQQMIQESIASERRALSVAKFEEKTSAKIESRNAHVSSVADYTLQLLYLFKIIFFTY